MITIKESIIFRVIKYVFQILLFLSFFNVNAQKDEVKANNICNTDACIIKLANSIKYQFPDSAINYCNQIILVKNKPDSISHSVYELFGDAYWSKGDLITSISNYRKSLSYAQKLDDSEKISRGYSNLGYLYMEIGENDNAVSNLNKSIEIAQNNKLSEREIISKVYLAQAWGSNKQYQKAINLQKEILALRIKNKDTISIAVILNNLSNNYTRAGILDSSLKYMKQGLYYDKILKKERDITNDLMNLSEIYYGLGRYQESLTSIKDALKYVEKNNMGDDYKTSVYAKLSKTHAQLKNFEKAKYYIKLSINKLPKDNNKKRYADIYVQGSETYKAIGEIDSAYKYLMLYTLMNDSIYIEENAEKIAQMESKFELNTKNKEIKVLNADKLLKEAAIEKQVFQRNMLIAIAIMTLLFLAIIFNRLKITKKQKQVIEHQNEVVLEAHNELEEKNREIMDSITYAKRIQSAILPPNKIVKEYLQQSFILYKPKDIVAGDFYWLEQVNSKILFAAADCTGHGVPGAMVSVICNNGLNRSVREYGLTDPGQILDKTRAIVIQEFEKSEEEVKDGMDIALCSIDGKKLKYAGAHNPLWVIRGGEIIETKADKQPIGQFDNPKPYTTHTFNLETGDSLYIFSDGYVDQFGGEKGKKFKSKAFKTLLLSIQDKSMEDQKQIIDETFENWKGSLEQIDDVCVIGVRV